MSAHNVFKKIEAETGDVARGFAEADAVYEGTFSLPKIQHAHMETHGSIAWRTADGRIHVRTSTQAPHLTKIKARLPVRDVSRTRFTCFPNSSEAGSAASRKC